MTRRTRRRFATVLAAPAAALATWLVVRALGVDLAVTGPGDTTTVQPGAVLAASLAAALGGWAVAALLERRSARPLRQWARLGSTALAVSMVGPSRLADGSSAVALIALHVVTAVVVIAGFAGTLPRRRDRAGARRAQPLPGGHPAR